MFKLFKSIVGIIGTRGASAKVPAFGGVVGTRTSKEVFGVGR